MPLVSSGREDEEEDVARAIENSLRGEEAEMDDVETAIRRSRDEAHLGFQIGTWPSEGRSEAGDKRHDGYTRQDHQGGERDMKGNGIRGALTVPAPSHFPPSRSSASEHAQPAVPPANSKLDNLIAELQQNVRRGLPRLNDANSDTLVFIDPPARQPGLGEGAWREVVKHYSRAFRMRSQILKDAGSPFFDNLLGPTNQFRSKRRRNLVGNNAMPDNIKYVIDLTPPTEGEEALNLILDLSCPIGVRKWGLARRRWNIAATLVSGQDEFADIHAETDTDTRFMVMTDQTLARESHAEYAMPEDYTPLRHRVAIERVLNAMSGKDPKLDSAAKVWTTCAVAKNFGIRHSLLTDYIVRWLRAPPNTLFLEVLPEVALQIADGLQCQSLCRDVFAILVGEAALESARLGRGYPISYNIHGRKLGDLTEAYLTRVQYAKDVFLERIQDQFDRLVGNYMKWIEDIPEVRKASAYLLADGACELAFDDLVSILKEFVRGGIYHLMCMDYNTMPGPVLDRGGAGDLFPNITLRESWQRLRCRDRCLTRTFWRLLQGCRFRNWDTNLMIQPNNSFQKPTRTTTEAQELQRAGVYRRVTHVEVREKIAKCLNLIQPISTSPSAKFSHDQTTSPDRGGSLGHTDPTNGPSLRKRPYNQDTEGQDLPYSIPFRPAGTQQINEVAAPGSDPKRRLFRNLLPRGQNENASQPESITSHGSQGMAEEPILSQPQNTLLTWEDLNQGPITLPFRMATPNDQPIPILPLLPRNPSLETQTPTSEGLRPWTSIRWEAQPTTLTTPSDRSSPYSKEGPLSFFNLKAFSSQVEGYLSVLSSRMLATPSVSSHDAFDLQLTDTLDLQLTNTLVCLQDEEMKFLPLWAGGNDDDSGGVYNDNVPIADVGFSTAGPRVHTGVDSSAASSSEFEMVDGQTTVRSSTVVNDGYGDGLDRRRVYDADEVWGEVLAGKGDGKGKGREFYREVGDDGTMESESTWERVETPRGSEDGFEVMGGMDEDEMVNVKGKGKEVSMADEDMFDDVFQEDDDNDGEFDFNSDNDTASFEYILKEPTAQQRLERSRDANATIIYRGGNDDDDRP